MSPERESASVTSASRLEEQGKTADASIIGHDADERKTLSTLAALLARKGYSLHELACGGFLIARFDRTAHCSDLGAVRAFYDRLGGAK